MNSNELITSNLTNAAPNAPEHPLSTEKFYVVEFPGYVREGSVSRAVEHLGGHARVCNAFRKNMNKSDSLLELNWRPGNAFAHPIQGGVITSNNVLLKVRKRKFKQRRTERDGEFTAEVVGVIPRTVRFRYMADFQYAPDEGDSAVKLRKAMDAFDVDYIRNFVIPQEKEDYDVPLESGTRDSNSEPIVRSNLRLPPPPLFSPQDVPQVYNYKANSASMVTTYIDTETGTEKKRFINRSRWKGYHAASMPYRQIHVPSMPPDAVGDMAAEIDIRILSRLKELFEERPVWTRVALFNQFSASDVRELTNQKFIIPFVSYCFTDGPWRDTFVRFGYDPRKHAEARFYQRLYFRNVLHPIVRPSLIERTEQPKSSGVTTPTQTNSQPTGGSGPSTPSHIFDGVHLTKETAAYQLCDIVDPMLKAMIEDENGVRDECDEHDGWYTTYVLEQIKTVLRHKFFSLLEGHILSDDDCRTLLEAGSTAKYRDTHRIDSRKHNMAKGAASAEDAAARRLRASLDNKVAKTMSIRRR